MESVFTFMCPGGTTCSLRALLFYLKEFGALVAGVVHLDDGVMVPSSSSLSVSMAE